MNIFITGGSGFLGTHLTKFLINQGHHITIFDNFSNSNSKFFSIDNKIRIIEGNILDYSKVFDSMKNMELVIHLAAQISVKDSIENPENTMKINVQGTQNLLESCIENKTSNFIAVSSAAVFGNPSDIPLTEESLKKPISPYGKSKLMMEEKIIDFSKKHNLNSIILRLFNLYGQGQSPEYAGVITKFLERIREDKPLEIYGKGNQTRDFIHVDDATECINLAIKKLDGNTETIYNVGSGKIISILDLAHLLLKLSGKELPINYKPEIEGDILHSQTSISLVRKELGFEPQISLEEGLSRFIKDYF